jgi:transcriptional regulator with XRE-family HTH domain
VKTTGIRFPPKVVTTLRKEAGLTYEGLAVELDCSFVSIMRWRRRGGFNLDALLVMLRFACARELKVSTTELLAHLKKAAGPHVDISARCGHARITV